MYGRFFCGTVIGSTTFSCASETLTKYNFEVYDPLLWLHVMILGQKKQSCSRVRQNLAGRLRSGRVRETRPNADPTQPVIFRKPLAPTRPVRFEGPPDL